MRKLELLAPAKNLECGIAAIDHGADAVYIGAPHFGARAAAGNSVADIARLCAYAHTFGAKVYVTVNTIIYDDELAAVHSLLGELATAGVDAILVQDMAMLGMKNAHSPLSANHHSLHFHASTQTDNRTPEKVRWLHSLGFSRVVLARELSVDEIAAIHREVPDVELEVFVHGALCVSYSGLCYASQHCFGRSANRGECAQFCRMKFDLIDADGNELQHQRHLLSLKDMNQSDALEELAEAGACSFKIEGRLKDINYVKNVTAAYSQRLDALVARHPDRYERASAGHVTYTFTPDLKKTFNRGYTHYFLHGRQPDIASFDTPKALGERVGTVKELHPTWLSVAGISSFANGDGLCFLNGNRELEGFRVNRAEGNRLYPQRMPQTLRPGMALYRNNDQEFERTLSRPSAVRKIPVSMRLEAIPTGYRLYMSAANQHKECFADIDEPHQEAEKPQRDNIVRQLSKLGGTPYECTEVILPDDFNYFIPSSRLAELRREVVSKFVERDNEITELRNNEITELRDNETTAFRKNERPGKQPNLYDNIANREACRFYGVSQPTAFELQPPQEPSFLMQCRHCLRYALGFCPKHGGRRPSWKEPLSLRLGDGRTFPLQFDCKHCQMNVLTSLFHLIAFLLLLPLLGSCYYQSPQTSDAWSLTEQQVDSISFYSTHHYTQNYNFRVKADTLWLVVQHPTEAVNGLPVDTISVVHGDRVVVADITTMPSDEADSVWVKVARDQQTIGWVHETQMLAAVAPDAPISRFIDFFSDAHLLIFLALLTVVVASYVVMRLLRHNARLVHFNDINSFYPTLLALLVASAAVFYSTIQLSAPDSWRHYYYHPTLNPFGVPLHLGLFLLSVWSIVIVSIAAADDVRRQLPLGEAVVYCLGLAGVCALNYVVFSVTTLFYLGYPLLVAYTLFALWAYLRHSRRTYVCGYCGKPLQQKGICPHCGADNT